MQNTNKKILFTNKLQVRIDDINYGNHLCHAKLISILHDTRALFLKKMGFTEINCFGFGLIMLNLSIDYLGECFFGDKLEVNMYLGTLENAGIEFSYTVTNLTLQKIAARAITLMSFFDKEKSKIRRIPEEFKELVNSIL